MDYGQIISPGEERFEKFRRPRDSSRNTGLVVHLLPLEGLTPEAKLAAILGVVLVFWLTEAVPIP